MYCIDASVFLSAAHGNEVASERSKKFLDSIRLEETKVFIPETVIAEIASGIFRATKDAHRAYGVVDAARGTPNFTFVAVDGHVSDIAVDVIIQTGLKSADAIYVALTLEYGLTLVTLDKEQLYKGSNMVITREP